MDAYVLKLDILGYFMNIDRQLIYDMILYKLSNFQRKHQRPWYDLCVFLLDKVIFNDPIQHCLIKGSAEDWKGLPKSKSLFNAPPGKGFPIGNLTSQLFGNIYLNQFDHYVKEQLGISYYGRYVDDFILIHQEKNHLKSLIPHIHGYLKKKLGLDLHPRKIYLQHYSKGFQFLGTYIKPYRTYIGKRTKSGFYQAVQQWNNHITATNGKLDSASLLQFIATINSYLGAMKHFDTYKLRKKLLLQLRGEFFNYVYISGGYAKLVAKRRRVRKRLVG